jgi:hypothetical protein
MRRIVSASRLWCFGRMRGWARDRAYLSKPPVNGEGYARLAEQPASTIVKALPRSPAVVTAAVR